MLRIMDERIVLRLAPDEVAYAASLIGADSLVGFGDPYWSLISDEVLVSMKEAHERLLEKGFLRTGHNETLNIDMTLLETIRACVEAHTVYIKNIRLSEESEEVIIYHCSDTLCIEHVLPRSNKEEIDISLHNGADQAMSRICDLSDLTGEYSVLAGEFQVTVDEFWELMKEAKDEQVEVRALGNEKNQSEPSKEIFLRSLRFPTAIHSILRVGQREGGWESSGVAFLKSEHLLWKLTSNFNGENISFIIGSSNFEQAKEATREITKSLGNKGPDR